MNAQLLFPRLGRAITSTGNPGFLRMLHDVILTSLAVDAIHIAQLPSGSTSSDPSPVYTDSISNPGADGQTCAQLHLTGHKDDYSYVISVYRSNPSCDFSEQERITLQDLSPLLLTMVEKHISALQGRTDREDNPSAAPTPESQGMETLRLRFADRLSQSGLSLSNREMEVCVGLLAGRTAPELAEQSNLKVNTVESYLKRAAIKMGISGRHSLIRWMYSSDDDIQTTSPLTMA